MDPAGLAAECVEAAWTSAEDGRALIEVRDSGIWMTPAEGERLLERFSRAEGATARRSAASAWPAVTRGIVLAHAGAIGCPQRRRGRFRVPVTLPAA